MSHLLRPMTALAIAGAVAMSAPAEAKDLIIVDGPIIAKDVKCDTCVQRRDIGNRAVKKVTASPDSPS